MALAPEEGITQGHGTASEHVFASRVGASYGAREAGGRTLSESRGRYRTGGTTMRKPALLRAALMAAALVALLGVTAAAVSGARPLALKRARGTV